MPGMCPSSLCSSLPRIQVICVAGQASCRVRTTGSAWQTSPSADRRSTQIDAGGAVNSGGDMCVAKGRQRRRDREQSAPMNESAAAGEEALARRAGGAMLYDASAIGQSDFGLLRPGSLAAGRQGRNRRRAAAARSRSCARRRASAGCLRHYRRGGLMARLADDLYLWTGEERTRAFREWRLLRQLREWQLPVPRPIAAGYRRHGLAYRADLLTEELPVRRDAGAGLARRRAARDPPGKPSVAASAPCMRAACSMPTSTPTTCCWANRARSTCSISTAG